MSSDLSVLPLSSGPVPLGARVEIFPSQPLPELDTPDARAFVARYRADSTVSLYALICASPQPPRLDAVGAMRTADHPALLKLVESGVVPWPDGSQAYALVYHCPVGPRMIQKTDTAWLVPNEDSIHQHFIVPMIGALAVLKNAGLVHHAIHPGNIFWRIGTAAVPQIGEGLSTPAGFRQPVTFETIERALASPLGRGVGSPLDDSYAFGVTLAFLVLGHNPFQKMDDPTILNLKIQKGSFGALVGTQRLLPAHIEILRGLLADDERQRWSASDLELWQGGRRMTTKSSDASQRALRHFDFMGQTYWQARPLAIAFAAHVEEAAKSLDGDALDKWLRHALNDEERATNLRAVMKDMKRDAKITHYEAQLVARACIVLDPPAPIRYRGVSALPTGLAPLLAEALRDGVSPAPLIEIIATDLVSIWASMQSESPVDLVALNILFDRLKKLVEKPSFGNGVERVVYETNPALPCLSPLLRGQYVLAPRTLLPALEKVAGSGNRSRDPMDRSLAAFLAARDKYGESTFAPLSLPEGSVNRGLALLSLYALLQTRYGPDRLPQLAGWLAPYAEIALHRFMKKRNRESLGKQVKEVVSAGDLGRILQLVDDPSRLDQDHKDFAAARLLYATIEQEIALLDSKLEDRAAILQGIGRPLAASLSSFLALVIVVVAILRPLFRALFP